MPRKSSSDNIIPLPGKGRPAPSPKLTRAEQAAWRAVVDSSPERWLDPAAQQLLRRLVVQLGLAERFEQRLRQVVAAGGPIEAEIELARVHRDTSKSIVAMMTALRATPRAHVELRAARSAFERSPSGERPWDIEGQAQQIGPEAEDDRPSA
jgi:hypothetical protein